MDVAINTGSLSLDTPEALDRAAALGFRAVEINLQHAEFGYGFDRKVRFDFYTRLAEDVRARGLAVTSVHVPGLTGAQVFSSRVRGDILKSSARIAGLLGAPALVAHPAELFSGYEALERYFTGGPEISPPVVDGYDEAWAQLANRRIALAVENISYWQRAVSTNQPERMARLLIDLGVHAVLDVRHVLPAGGDPAAARNALARWVDAAGRRIVLLHVHAAAADGGGHAPPLSPDWAALAPLLRRTAARACVLEVDGAYGDGALRESREYIEGLLGNGA